MKNVAATPSIADLIVDPVKTPDASTDKTLLEILRAIREHLGMDVAFISEFTGADRVFRYVDSSHADHPVRAGGADRLEDSYCQRIIDGRLPQLIPDASACPAAMELTVTYTLPVGAHLSVPIRLTDGSVYGTFCCFSHAPDSTLNERDLGLMRVFADLTGRQIERDLALRKQDEEIAQRIRSVLNGDGLSMAYQPIYHLGDNRIVGFESLSRFSATPIRTPDVWFGEAHKIGLDVALETKAIGIALQGIGHLPGDVYISVNISPETILGGAIGNMLGGMPLERVVLEVTEHVLIQRYHDIAALIGPLRERGLRIAVDDAGAGYASFRHILNLAPDLIKLDVSLTRNIDADNSRRALAAALIRFSEETGSEIIAEGVETASELDVLRQLGVTKAQGYLLGRPMPLAAAAQLCPHSACRL
jgi:EAL domain-containing protein (putative c-di-GMP-specific phosphodiesterase class I)